MKKLVFIIMSAIIAFNSIGCRNKEEEQGKSEYKENFDIKIATNILDSYMKYIYNGDLENAKKIYSEEITKKKISLYNTDITINGYKTDEINEVGRTGIFTVKIVKNSKAKPMSVLDEYNIKVERIDNDYKITDISTNNDKEAFLESGGIRIRDKTNVKTNLVIDMSGIPEYAFPKDDAAKINKAPVPKTSFGLLCFTYSGERMAVTTHDGNSYIGVVKIDESMATQGGGGASGGGGGGGSAGGGGGAGGGAGGAPGGSANVIKEPPVGKDITSLDIIKDSTIDLVNFSLEEKYLVVQYKNKNKDTMLRTYDIDSGEMIKYNFEENFPIDKVDVVFSSFDKDVLNFEVKQKATTGKSQSDMIGKWQLDLKEFKIKRL